MAATWTNISDEFLEPGKPVRSVDGLALRDNPIAIAEGASGAPRIRTAALQPPAAGSTHIIMRLQDATIRTTADAYPNARLHSRGGAAQHLGVTCLVSGVIRAYAEHRVTGDGDGTGFLRVLKNGSLVTEWSTSSATFQTRTVDVSVDVGDSIVFQQRLANAYNLEVEWRNLRIYSANPDMAVA